MQGKTLKSELMSVQQVVSLFSFRFIFFNRREMNLRTVSNLLLAFASLLPSTRPFMAKYYSASVLLPSDWTTISDLVQTFEEMEGKVGSLPSSLRRVMVPKFEEFDEYQLAKYNKTIKQVWRLTQFDLFAFF